MISYIKKELRRRLERNIEETRVYDAKSKIPVGDVFLNNNVHGGPNGPNWGLARVIDVYRDDESFERLPVEPIDVRKIIPTQRFITIDNLEDIKDREHERNTGAYLVNYKGMYYIIDGHHRIANKIMKGERIIRAHVYTI